MSPLAKKKLLAQVSEAESLHCPKRHCPEGQQASSDIGHSPEPPRPATGPHLDEQSSPEPSGAHQDPAPSEVGTIPGGRDKEACLRPGGPAPPVFTGCFHAYRSEVPKPVGCHPLWGCFSSLKDILEPSPSTFSPPRAEELPQDLRSKGRQPWSGESRRAAAKGCWVPPGASVASAVPRGKRGRREEEEEDEEEEEEDEEEAFSPQAKLRAVSPLEAEGRDVGAGSPGVLAKPKAVMASPGYASALPQAPGAYKGVMLHFPLSFGNQLEHLKTQGVPVPPALSLNPFIIPAFPSPLVTAAMQPSDLCRPLATGPGPYPLAYGSSPRHRLHPRGTWHRQHSYSSPHLSAFHRHSKM
ncbi:ARI5A protein, partial [Galbula dea]|nr:ARI5A protein [Galbula dea]